MRVAVPDGVAVPEAGESLGDAVDVARHALLQRRSGATLDCRRRLCLELELQKYN